MPRRRNRRPKPTTDLRPPEARLEALVREPNPDRAHRMMSRILDDLEAGGDHGPWIASARTLSERLIISEDAFYYLAYMFTEALLLDASESDPELCRIRDAMDVIERAHGLREGESWLVHEAPDEWRAFDDEWNCRAEDVIVSSWRALGHGDLADLRERDPDGFEARTARGQAEIWGEDEDVEDVSPSS